MTTEASTVPYEEEDAMRTQRRIARSKARLQYAQFIKNVEWRRNLLVPAEQRKEMWEVFLHYLVRDPSVKHLTHFTAYGENNSLPDLSLEEYEQLLEALARPIGYTSDERARIMDACRRHGVTRAEIEAWAAERRPLIRHLRGQQVQFHASRSVFAYKPWCIAEAYESLAPLVAEEKTRSD